MTDITIEKIVYAFEADVDNAARGMTRVERSFKSVDGSADRSSGKLKGVSGAAAGLASAINPATIAVAGLTVGLGLLTVAAKDSIGVFEDYQQEITNSAAVTGTFGDVYIRTFENIDEVAQTLGKSTVFTATQSANAIYDIASAGEDVANLTTRQTEPMMDLASGTQYDLTRSTELLIGTVATFGGTMDDTRHYADVYTKTVGSSRATMDKLALSHGYVAGTAESLGLEIEDLNAVLAVMYNRNVKGEKAGSSLNMAMVKLLDPTREMIDVYSEMGIKFDEVDPLARNFVDILETLNAAGIDPRQASILFGAEAVSPMLKLIENIPQVRQYQNELRNTEGYSAKLAAQQLDTAHGSKLLMQSAIEGSKINFGGHMEGGVREFYGTITDFMPKIDLFVDKVFEIASAGKELIQPWIDAEKRIVSAGTGIIKDMIEPLGESLTGGDLSGFKLLADDIVYGLAMGKNAMASVLEFIDENPIFVRWPADILRGILELASAAYKAFVDIRKWAFNEIGGAIDFVIGKYNSLVPYMQAAGMAVEIINLDMFKPLETSAEKAHMEVKDEMDQMVTDVKADLGEMTGAASQANLSPDTEIIPGAQRSYEKIYGQEKVQNIREKYNDDSLLRGVFNQDVARQYGLVSDRIQAISKESSEEVASVDSEQNMFSGVGVPMFPMSQGPFAYSPTVQSLIPGFGYNDKESIKEKSINDPVMPVSINADPFSSVFKLDQQYQAIQNTTRAPNTALVQSNMANTSVTADLKEAIKGMKEQFIDALKQEPRKADVDMDVKVETSMDARTLQRLIADATARGISGYSV